MASSPSPSAIPISEPKAVFEISVLAWGLVALLAIVLAALYLRQARRRSQQAQTSGETAASRPSQLQQFLSGLTASQITSLAEGERPEVVAAILHHVPDPGMATAVQQQMNVPPSGLSEPTRPAREGTLVSFTEALRSKLAADQNTLGTGSRRNPFIGGSATERHPWFDLNKPSADIEQRLADLEKRLATSEQD